MPGLILPETLRADPFMRAVCGQIASLQKIIHSKGLETPGDGGGGNRAEKVRHKATDTPLSRIALMAIRVPYYGGTRVSSHLTQLSLQPRYPLFLSAQL